MEKSGEQVGEIIVQVTHGVEVFVDAALNEQGAAAHSRDGEAAADDLPEQWPHFQQWREGDEVHQDGQEGADMIDDAHRVGGQVQEC